MFNNISGEESYRGEHLKDIVITFAKMFPDVHRELHRVNVMGDVVAIELSIQGTFRGPMETPAGVIQPTGAKVNIPCADFFHMKNGKIERFDCYPALNIMLKQMGVPPLKAPRQRYSVNPVYPPLTRDARIWGTVVVDAVIDEHGNVVQARVLSGHPLLIDAALKAVLQWKYEPTTLNGQAVSVELQVQVHFNLNS